MPYGLTKTELTKAAKSPLEKDVAKWAVDYSEGDVDGVPDALKSLMEHGISSGMVGHLVYYADTAKYFEKHKKEIKEMLKELSDDTGEQYPQALRDWDAEDPFADEEHNQNLLAWFGFEESAHRLANNLGLEF